MFAFGSAGVYDYTYYSIGIIPRNIYRINNFIGALKSKSKWNGVMCANIKWPSQLHLSVDVTASHTNASHVGGGDPVAHTCNWAMLRK